MSQKIKEKTKKRSIKFVESTSEASNSTSTASAQAVSKAWQSFKPQIELSYILAARNAAREKNS